MSWRLPLRLSSNTEDADLKLALSADVLNLIPRKRNRALEMRIESSVVGSLKPLLLVRKAPLTSFSSLEHEFESRWGHWILCWYEILTEPRSADPTTP